MRFGAATPVYEAWASRFVNRCDAVSETCTSHLVPLVYGWGRLPPSLCDVVPLVWSCASRLITTFVGLEAAAL